MPVIYTSENFIVYAPEAPLVDREDGGHIVIEPKIPVSRRQDLSLVLSNELMRLISITGEAMTRVLTRNGIEIGRINYQDNGNWSVFAPGGPKMHYHLYGRAVNAKIQRYGQSLYFPHKDEQPEFYKDLKGLIERDRVEIKEEMERLFGEEIF